MPQIRSTQRPSSSELHDDRPLGIEMQAAPRAAFERRARGIDEHRRADPLALDPRDHRVRFGPCERGDDVRALGARECRRARTMLVGK